jgi:hypothetical protein
MIIRSVTSSSSNPSSINGTSNGQARLLTRTLLSAARSAFSYAPLRIVARVPITPMCRLRVACNAARAPGSITPITGTGNFCVNNGSATDETVLHATTSAFAFLPISITASSTA